MTGRNSSEDFAPPSIPRSWPRPHGAAPSKAGIRRSRMDDTRKDTGVSLKEMERIVDGARIENCQVEDEKRDRKCAQQVKARETAELLEQHLSFEVLNKLKDVIATRNGRKALAHALLVLLRHNCC